MRFRWVPYAAAASIGLLWLSTVGLHGTRNDLRRAEADARAASIPLTPAEFPIPSPPSDENAAADYELLTVKFKGVGRPGFFPSPWEVLAVFRRREMERLVAKRPDITELVHTAILKPRYYLPVRFVAWDQLPRSETSHYTVNWLAWEGWSEAQKGDIEQAVKTTALGFRVADHTAKSPFLLSLLVSLSATSNTLENLQSMLRIYGCDDKAVAAITEALSGRQVQTDPSYWIHGEIIAARGYILQLTRSDLRLINNMSSPVGPREAMLHAARYMPEPVFLARIQHPACVFYLNEMTSTMKVFHLPEPRRTQALAELQRKIFSRSANWTLPESIGIIPIANYHALVTALNGLEGERRVTLAAAAVLAYHNRADKWPAHLSDAMESVPRDPFDPSRRVRYRRQGDSFLVEAGVPKAKFVSGGRDYVSDGVIFSYPDERSALRLSERHRT